MASVAIRRNSSNDMTGISRWPTLMTVGVPSSIWMATMRSGLLVSRPIQSDERVVEEVALPGAVAVVGLRVPDLGGAGLATDVVAGDERAIPVERHLGDDVVHHVDEGVRDRRIDDRLRAGRDRDVAVPDRLDDMRLDERPAVHQRRVRRRELDRRDGDTLPERAVGEVDLRASR